MPPVLTEMKPPAAQDAVEGAAIDDQVADDGKGGGPERLDRDRVAVAEFAHVELAGGGGCFGAVRDAVDHQRAHAADAFAAVVVEGNGLLALGDEVLVENVEHFQERHLGNDVADLVGFEAALGLAGFLSPDF